MQTTKTKPRPVVIERIDYAGEVRGPVPVYYGVEVEGEQDAFRCPALSDTMTFSAEHLRQWAEAICCNLVLLRWLPETAGALTTEAF